MGQLLRDWRTARGISQLDLALHARFSARHVSFIEAGGFAHIYRQTPFAAEEMSHIRGVLQFILDRHKPYAAVVLDRYSNCVMGNDASQRLVAALVDPSLLANPVNFLRITYHPCGARRWIVNWDELSRHLLGRAERELGVTTNDPTGAALLDEMRGHMGTQAYERFPSRQDAADLLVPIHVRKDDLELRLFCTYMTLGTPQDVTLQELRIETFFPADEASEPTWHERFASFVSPAFSQHST